jgi:hypothetical protein
MLAICVSLHIDMLNNTISQMKHSRTDSSTMLIKIRNVFAGSKNNLIMMTMIMMMIEQISVLLNTVHYTKLSRVLGNISKP